MGILSITDFNSSLTFLAIDNSAVLQLVRELRREAEGVLIDLGHMPVNRRVLREQGKAGASQYNPDQLETAVGATEAPAIVPTSLHRRRRIGETASENEGENGEQHIVELPPQTPLRRSRRTNRQYQENLS